MLTETLKLFIVSNKMIVLNYICFFSYGTVLYLTNCKFPKLPLLEAEIADYFNPVHRVISQYLFFSIQAKEREFDLKNQWAQNKMTKRQSQSKYGF